MKKNDIVGVWNHDSNAEDAGIVVEVIWIKSKYNHQLEKKYNVMIGGKIYELFDFQMFRPGKATKNISSLSLGRCFFSKQGKYERIDLMGATQS
jgi:hypothetical protein